MVQSSQLLQDFGMRWILDENSFVRLLRGEVLRNFELISTAVFVSDFPTVTMLILKLRTRLSEENRTRTILTSFCCS